MDVQISDDELEQLLQSLDDIPPGNLPQDGMYPFSFHEAYSYPNIPAFVDGDPLSTPKANDSTWDFKMQTEGLKVQVEELENQCVYPSIT
jgi:hypothetical protein